MILATKSYFIPVINLYLFGAFRLLINGQPVDGFRSDKTRALLAYLALANNQPIARITLANLLWDGYQVESALANLRMTLSNLRHILAPLDLLEINRQTVKLGLDPSQFWCDALPPEWSDHDAHQVIFFPGGERIDSAPFQLWLQERRAAYEQEHLAQRLARQTPTRQLPLIPNNLPRVLTPLIGRERDIEAVRTLVDNDTHPLITLMGEGGIGKTRLALAIAHAIVDSEFHNINAQPIPTHPPPSTLHYPPSTIPPPKLLDGIWFVPLAGIAPGENLPNHLATAIGEAIRFKFSGTEPLTDQLCRYLYSKRALLILDNFEQLTEDAGWLVILLQKTMNLKVLVTSRQRLNLEAEYLFRLDGLAAPDEESPPALAETELYAYSSVQLFLECAQRTSQDFQLTRTNMADVARICRFVGGLPLGLVLATTLLEKHSCAQIAAKLDENYAVLAATLGDLPPRQRSIQAVLDASWQLLDQVEQIVLAQFAVFRGTFSAEAAKTVTAATPAIFERLEAKSLLRQPNAGRYELHELVRQYAAAQLAQDPERQQHAVARHAAYYMDLLHSLEEILWVDFEAQQTIRHELDNIRLAWRWGVKQGNWALLERGAESLQHFFRLAGIYDEAIHLLETALAVVRPLVALSAAQPQPQQLLARWSCYLVQFYRRVGGLEVGEKIAQEALDWARQLADPALQGLALHELARLAQMRGDFATMVTLAEQACAQARLTAAPHLNAETLNTLGIAVGVSRGPLTAIPHFQAALQALQDAPNHNLEAIVIGNLGFFLLNCHEYQLASRYLQQSLALHEIFQSREGRVITRIHLGDLWAALGASAAAQQHYEEALALVQTMHAPYWESWLYVSYGRLQHLRGDLAAAHRSCTLAQQIAQKNGIHLQEQWALVHLGHVLTDLGELTAASHCYQQAISRHQPAWAYRTTDAHAGLATLGLAQNAVATAVGQAEAALALLAQTNLASTREPVQVYWICYRVFKAADDPRAAEILRTAYQTLQGITSKLEDETVRRSFQENVVANRNLIAAAQAAGIR